MLHILLHVAVPSVVAVVVYRPRQVRAAFTMVATMAVDLDHLWADPFYDAQRCSIGFHPLHTTPAITLYLLAFALTVLFARWLQADGRESQTRMVQLVALGLLIHMALDWTDCVL